MTTQQFRDALHNQPFRPFVIRTADGRDYRVDHPEMAMLSQGGRTAVVHASEESFAILDLLLVAALEFETASRT